MEGFVSPFPYINLNSFKTPCTLNFGVETHDLIFDKLGLKCRIGATGVKLLASVAINYMSKICPLIQLILIQLSLNSSKI